MVKLVLIWLCCYCYSTSIVRY